MRHTEVTRTLNSSDPTVSASTFQVESSCGCVELTYLRTNVGKKETLSWRIVSPVTGGGCCSVRPRFSRKAIEALEEVALAHGAPVFSHSALGGSMTVSDQVAQRVSDKVLQILRDAGSFAWDPGTRKPSCRHR